MSTRSTTGAAMGSLLASLLLAACGGDTSGEGGGDACRGPNPDDYFPTLDGSRYVYAHTPAAGQPYTETVTFTAVDYAGSDAVLVAGEGDPTGEQVDAYWVRSAGADGDSVRRVHKDVRMGGAPVMSVDYDPGFLRFDHAWLDQPVGEPFELSYTRTETAADGTVKQDPRTHRFVVESQHEPLTLGNCPYDTVRIRRARVGFGGDEAKVFWFAPGVGKVKEQNLASGSIEELQQVSFGAQ